MEPSREPAGRLAVMHLSGDVDAATTPALDADVQDVLTPPAPSVLILEVSEVRFWDSAGLSMIVRAVKATRARGTRLVLAGARPQLRHRLELTCLTDLFELYDSLEEALAGLRRQGPGNVGGGR
ncbi:STAS domain-containing protein [Herbidospora mongoliensis]|uniref:STAS domain-containing protein n=1 Tax=Herbidospora mongoliensis TaxID=688067 RepID=UPI0008366631|nr:STAS domain-containing protein [Herbidospora mongoliensis]